MLSFHLSTSPPALVTRPFWPGWNGVSLWLLFDFPWWPVMLNIVSYVCWLWLLHHWDPPAHFISTFIYLIVWFISMYPSVLFEFLYCILTLESLTMRDLDTWVPIYSTEQTSVRYIASNIFSYFVDCLFARNVAFIATKRSFNFKKSEFSTDVFFPETLDSCQVLAFSCFYQFSSISLHFRFQHNKGSI